MFQHSPGLRQRMRGLRQIHYDVTDLPKRSPLQWLCEKIGQHLPCGIVLHSHLLGRHSVRHEDISYVDMTCALAA